MNKILSLLVTACLFQPALTQAQSLAVNTDGSSAATSSILDVKSTSKGILIPRMTSAQKYGIASPANGLLIFQTGPDSIGFHYYNSGVWTWLSNSGPNTDWLLNGNTGTVAGSNYLGTTDNTDLVLKTNGFENLRLHRNGLSGFYESGPSYTIDASMGAAAVFPCSRSGLRLKPVGVSSDCDYGLFFGYNANNSMANAAIWNYASNGTGAQNLLFGLNAFEWMRLTKDGFLALGETNPQYTLDTKIGMAAYYPCTRNGMRINIPTNSNDCSNGLFFGYVNNIQVSDAMLWNYGTNSSGSNNLIFGMNNLEAMRLNYNAFAGFGETNPQYNLDMKIGMTAVFPCTRNGIRINLPANSNNCDRGMFIGYDNNALDDKTSIWNFAGGGPPNSLIMRFGLGADFTTGERMRITNTAVGVLTSSPSSSLHVDGTFAVGVSMPVAGGGIGTPTMINTEKSYIGLNPAGGAVYYQLPNPVNCPGRIYYIRNNSSTDNAQLGTVSGLMCPGNGNCLAPGSYYQLNFGSSVKTVICISDGVNWTIGKID